MPAVGILALQGDVEKHAEHLLAAGAEPRPVLTAVAILSFMYHWNDYGGPLIYLSSTEKLPLSVGLANFNEAYGGTPYHLMMAASLIAVAPLIIIFFGLNRYFVQGVVVSGVKG